MTAVRSVLMFCSQFRPIVGGAERQAEKLSKALVRKGLRVKVLTPRWGPDAPVHEIDCGVEIHRFPFFDLAKAIPIHGIGPLNLLSARHQTMQALWRNLGDAQIVHAHIASAFSLFAMQAAQCRAVPFLCKAAVGGGKSDLSELSEGSASGPLLARRFARDLTCWIAITDAVRDSLLKWGINPARIVKIPNGVEPVADGHRLTSSEPVRRFLYLGRLAANINRDVPTLIRAFDRIADEFADAELAIIGDGDLFGETADLVSAVRHKSRIQMPGERPPRPWLEWAHCFVLPSRYEGLSNALLEAMAQGLPCIANDIPPNREVLDDGRAGLLVPVGDVDELYSAMKMITAGDELAERLGRLAKARVEDVYSIDAVADRYIELYECLLNTRVLNTRTPASTLE